MNEHHIISMVPIGVVLTLMWGFMIYLMGIIFKRLDRIEEKLDKQFVTKNFCVKLSEEMKQKLNGIDQLTKHHTHDPDGNVIIR